MIRLTVVTLAALYTVLHIFGNEDRRPDNVARSEPMALEVVGLSALSVTDQLQVKTESGLSDAKAIELAMAAGKKLRDERRKAPLGTLMVASAEVTSDQADVVEPIASYWYVTGSRVNLREGPGTGNPVIGQVTWGTEAEVLSDQNGWFEIRVADGSASGWIFGKFLNDQRPG